MSLEIYLRLSISALLCGLVMSFGISEALARKIMDCVNADSAAYGKVLDEFDHVSSVHDGNMGIGNPTTTFPDPAVCFGTHDVVELDEFGNPTGRGFNYNMLVTFTTDERADVTVLGTCINRTGTTPPDGSIIDATGTLVRRPLLDPTGPFVMPFAAHVATTLRGTFCGNPGLSEADDFVFETRSKGMDIETFIGHRTYASGSIAELTAKDFARFISKMKGDAGKFRGEFNECFPTAYDPDNPEDELCTRHRVCEGSIAKTVVTTSSVTAVPTPPGGTEITILDATCLDTPVETSPSP